MCTGFREIFNGGRIERILINDCRLYFDFMLPSELLVKIKSNFLRKFNSVVLVWSPILALGNVCGNLLFIS